jgi:AraC family transcriptional regulator
MMRSNENLPSDSYGSGFGQRIRAQASSFVTRALPKSMLAVTELRYDDPQFVLSTPPTAEDAFVLAVHLELFDRYEYWEDGKAAKVSTIKPGETIIYGINRKPVFHLNSPFHSVHFYMPKDASDAIADEANAPRIDGLHYQPAVSHADTFLRNVAEALLPKFQSPDDVNQLFIDHLMLAVGHHINTTYGGMRPMTKPISGGLTPAQERRAKELLEASVIGNLRLADLARECGLSASHFTKSFRQSVGMPPHQWLLQQRLERAKLLLRDEDAQLAEIALATGFSDQSHFTRHFSAKTGLSPGRWRRSLSK